MPSRGGDLGPPRQVSSDRGLADLNAELDQFAMDAGSDPERVGQAHVADRITDLRALLGPSQTASSPPPVEREAFAMPLAHRCWFDQHQGVQDLRPQSVKPYPEQPVGGEESNPTSALPP